MASGDLTSDLSLVNWGADGSAVMAAIDALNLPLTTDRVVIQGFVVSGQIQFVVGKITREA